MSDITDNVHYIEGYYVAKRMADIIDKTAYKTLEAAIEAKSGLIEQLKDNFDWNEEQKDIAFNLGMVTAWKEILKENGPSKVKGQITLDEINECLTSLGVSITLENAEDMVKRYPDFKEKCDPEWTNERVVEEMLKHYD